MRITFDLTDGEVAELEKLKDLYNKRNEGRLTLEEWLVQHYRELAVQDKLLVSVRHLKDDVMERKQQEAQQEIETTIAAERDRLIAEL